MRLKLISPKDTLLGHIDVPEHFAQSYERRDAISFAIAPRPSIGELLTTGVAHTVNIKSITLVKASWSQYPDAVYLCEGTIEDFERLPGCSFSPSIAYLRSQIF